MKKLLLLSAALLMGGVCFAAPLKISPENKGLRFYGLTKERTSFVNGVLTVNSPDMKGCTCGLRLPAAPYAGKRVILSAEVKRDVPKCQKWQGGKLMLAYKRKNGHWDWPSPYMAPGKYDWQKLSQTVNLPTDVTEIQLVLGIQSGMGSISYRNITLEEGDTLLNLSAFANRAYADKIANDGKGGWSDQGPKNDGSGFLYKQKIFANVPFAPIDPKKNNDKSVLVFQSEKFAGGIREASVKLAAKVPAKYIYLLHTLCHGYGYKGIVGYVDIVGTNGKVLTRPVTGMTDIGDWWNANPLPNGFPATTWRTEAGGLVSMYLTRYEIESEIGPIDRVVLRSSNTGAIWIVSAVTLSNNNYPLPKSQTITIKKSEKWRERAFGQQKVGVKKGSVLDLTDVLPVQPVSKTGRIIVNKKGQFAFETAPDKPVRFLTNTILLAPFYGHNKAPKEFTDKAAIMEYCREMRRQGYNMIRFHYLDDTLGHDKSKKEFEFNPKTLDTFDYVLYCMRENGIYANFDCMARTAGYNKCSNWWHVPGFKYTYGRDLFFLDSARENWKMGVTKLLNHYNPYTKMKIKDDPVLAITVCYNEQAFAWGSSDLSVALPTWRAFLKKKYKNVAALEKAWGQKTGADSLDKVPIFKAGEIGVNSPRGTDIMEYKTEREQDLLKFYIDTIRGTGAKLLIGSNNLEQSIVTSDNRTKMDYVPLNCYKSHPFGDVSDAIASTEEKAKIIRSISSVQIDNKPLVMTEHGFIYWTKHRYEQGLMMGAYCALQDFGGLSAFSSPITIKEVSAKLPTGPFNMQDPTMKAAELITAFAFMRGDVKTSEKKVRLGVDIPALIKAGTANDTVDMSQSFFSLITKLRLTLDSKAKADKNTRDFPVCAGAPVIMQSKGFIMTVDSGKSASGTFEPDRVLNNMRAGGFLPKNNRTNYAKGIFESETGEILLDSNRYYLGVDTPKIQGICGHANTKAELSDVSIRKMTTNGSLVVIAREKDSVIKTAKRLLLVYVTNAHNDGTVFADPAHHRILNRGKSPVLLEAGAFEIAIRSSMKNCKAYAVGFDGTRVEELPVSYKNGRIVLKVDTAEIKAGIPFFFEIITK